MNSRLTGIADEGATEIHNQIAIHRELDWNAIELRTVRGVNICEMADDDFAPVAEAIESAGFSVPAFGSAIANWSRPVTGDFARDREDLLRAAPRMHRLGTRYLRIMSYTSGDLPEKEWASRAIKRVAELTRIAAGEGIVLVHENCDGWASQSPDRLARLLDEIPDPALQIVFDPGNPVAHGDPPESVCAFYRTARERIVHVHIKDCYLDPVTETVVHCYPGEGQCSVAEIVRDLEKTGYQGIYSIEPHMMVQIHRTTAGDTEGMRAVYSEYAARAEQLLRPFFV